MKLKVCGLKDKENINHVIRAGQPDYVGLIFHKPSPRFAKESLSGAHAKDIPESIRKVGVFVNSSVHEIQETAHNYKLDLIQLHGDETPEFCGKVKSLGLEVIKSFSLYEQFNFRILETYNTYCDFVLFDTAGKLRGGNGLKFNWDLLKDYHLKKPYFLSGGIAEEDAKLIRDIEDPRLHAVDINSRFEIEPGIKDVERIKRFAEALKKDQKHENKHLFSE